MLKKLKWLGVGVAVLLVLVLGGAWAVAQWVNPNQYKPHLVQWVKEATGRQLQIEDDIAVSIFPWVGVSSGRWALSNPAEFGAQPMLRVDELKVKVRLLPLFSRRLEIDTIVLKRPRIDLQVAADGRTNWDDLLPERAAARPADHAPNSAATALAGLIVQGVSIEDGWLGWHDRTKQQRLSLEALDLHSGKLRPGKPIQVALDATLVASDLPHPLEVRLATRAALADDWQSVALTATDLDLDSPTLSAEVAVASITYAIPAGVLTLAELEGELIQATAQSTAQSTLLVPALTVRVAEQGLELPRVELVQDSLRLQLHQVSGDGLWSGASRPRLSGQLEVAVADLERLCANYGLEVALPPATAATLTAQLGLKDSRARLSEIDLRMDAARLSGDLAMTNWSAPRWQLRAEATEMPVGMWLSAFDVTDAFIGRGDFTLNLAAQGRQFAQLRQTLSGSMGGRLPHGTVKGYDFAATIQRVIEQLAQLQRGDGVDAAPQPLDAETELTQLSVDIAAENGILSTQNLLATTPLFRLRGRGEVNLPQESLEVKIEVDAADGQTVAWLQQLGGVMPLKIAGPFAELRYSVDVTELLKQRLKRAVATEANIDAKADANLDVEAEVKEVLEQKLKQKLLEKLGVD